MNGYVDAGYIASIGTLTIYGAALLGRERSVRRHLGARRSAVVRGEDLTTQLLDATEPVVELSDERLLHEQRP